MLDGERGLGVWKEGENYEVWYLLGCGTAGRGGICLLLGEGRQYHSDAASATCKQKRGGDAAIIETFYVYQI